MRVAEDDDATNTYRQKWDIDSLSSDVYDLAAEIIDAAGNKTVLKVARLAVDNDDPDNVQISNIEAITPGAPEIEFCTRKSASCSTGQSGRTDSTLRVMMSLAMSSDTSFADPSIPAFPPSAARARTLVRSDGHRSRTDLSLHPVSAVTQPESRAFRRARSSGP